MTIVDNYGEVKEVDEQQVFNDSKCLIESTITQITTNIENHKEDIEQECGLAFYKQAVSNYKASSGIPIMEYLRKLYERTIYSYIKKEQRNRFARLNEEVAATSVGWEIAWENTFSDKEKQTIEKIMEGFTYKEVCNDFDSPKQARAFMKNLKRKLKEYYDEPTR